jgi:hypothetical protein
LLRQPFFIMRVKDCEILYLNYRVQEFYKPLYRLLRTKFNGRIFQKNEVVKIKKKI